MFFLLLSLLWELAKFILAKLMAKFASNNKKRKLSEGPFHYLPAENMVDIFAFISRPQIDQCELVNQRFRAIIERHKDKLPTLNLHEKENCRMEAFNRWKDDLIFAETLLFMDIFFIIYWILIMMETESFISFFLFVIIIILYCTWTAWNGTINRTALYCFVYFLLIGLIFQVYIIPLLLIYINQFYSYSILSKIYVAFLFPLILIQSQNLYKIQYFDGPPQR